MKRLAIIPARSGSKRIKNKNFKLINGCPMIDYTIKNLINSKLFHTIHVSSDINIKNKTFYFNEIDCFKRPKKISTDKTPIYDVAKWVLKKYEKKKINFDTICIAYATAPLLEVDDFIKACKLFEKSNKKYPLLSVCEFKPSVDEAMVLSTNRVVKPVSYKKFLTDSKKHKIYYYDTGSFIFTNKKHILEKNNKKSYLKYELDRFKGIDINNKNDLNFVKEILKKIKK